MVYVSAAAGIIGLVAVSSVGGLDTPGAAAASTVFVNVGGNISLPCVNASEDARVRWIWDGDRRRSPAAPPPLLGDGSLTLVAATLDDDGIVYTCQDAESNESLHSLLVRVRRRDMY